MSLNQTACEGFLPLPQLCRGTLEQGYPTAPGAPFPVLLEVPENSSFLQHLQVQSPHLQHTQQGPQDEYCSLFSSCQLRQKCHLRHKERNPAIVFTRCHAQKECAFLAITVYSSCTTGHTKTHFCLLKVGKYVQKIK